MFRVGSSVEGTPYSKQQERYIDEYDNVIKQLIRFIYERAYKILFFL